MTAAFDDLETLPPFYAAVLETEALLCKQKPNGFSFEELGVKAWATLSLADKQCDLPYVLGAYARVVRDERQERQRDQHAADLTHTYLDDSDTSVLWDATVGTPDEDGAVPALRDALLNVLCELELLQHRLAMRDQT